jgi:hypothetical protein
MPFPDKYFNRAMERLEGQERLLECLLWRGFMAEIKDGQVRLLNGSHPDDLRLLHECGLVINPDIDADGKYLAIVQIDVEYFRVLNPEIENVNEEYFLRKVFFSDPNDPAHVWDDNISVFSQWHQTTFVAPLKVDMLEPGIALLVNALRRLNIFTCMSCNGHYENTPFIFLTTKWDFHWFKHVLADFGHALGINANDQPWLFQEPDGQHHGQFKWKSPPKENDWFVRFRQMQRIARMLLKQAVPLRRKKEVIDSELGFDLLFIDQEPEYQHFRDYWSAAFGGNVDTWLHQKLEFNNQPADQAAVERFLRPMLAKKAKNLI